MATSAPQPTYPTNQLLGVIDDPAVAERAVAALLAAGFPSSDVTLMSPAAEQQPPRLWTRLVRLFQFMSMDQGPDFHYYEAAVREGRAVVAVRIRGRGPARAGARPPPGPWRPLPQLLRPLPDRGDHPVARPRTADRGLPEALRAFAWLRRPARVAWSARNRRLGPWRCRLGAWAGTGPRSAAWCAHRLQIHRRTVGLRAC